MRLARRLALVAGVPAGALAVTLIAVALHGQHLSTDAVGDALAAASTRLAAAQEASFSGVADRVVTATREGLMTKGRSLGAVAAGLAGESLVLEDDSGIEKVARKFLADEDCIGIWITTTDGVLHGGFVDQELRNLIAGAIAPAALLKALPERAATIPTVQVPIIVEKKTLGTVTLALSPERLRQREVAIRADLQKAQEESIALLKNTSTGLSATLASTTGKTAFWLVIAGSFSCLLLVPIGLFLGWRIARPVLQAGGVLNEVAAGDYHGHLPEEGQDELADLARALNTTVVTLRANQERITLQTQAAEAMNQRMQGLVEQLQASATTTASQAGEVSASAQVVSTRVQSVSAAMMQMAASGGEIAANTAEAARIARDTLRDARQVDTRVRSLGEASQSIGEIIAVIDGIASRTKLLALNASIEASKAGAAGSGFAVVAGEVRQLSQQTVVATKDIHARIGAIQGVVETIMADIQRITTTVERMDQLQAGVSTAIEEQSATTQNITGDLSEAAAGSRDIAEAVAQVAATARATTEALVPSTAT